MVEVIIPEDQILIGQPVAITVLKYSSEHGIEKGLDPTKRIYVEVGDIPMEYEQLQRFNGRSGMKIKLIQENPNQENPNQENPNQENPNQENLKIDTANTTKLSSEDSDNLKKLMRCIADIRTSRIAVGKKTRFDNHALEKVIEELDLVLDDITFRGDIGDYIAANKMILTLEGPLE